MLLLYSAGVDRLTLLLYHQEQFLDCKDSSRALDSPYLEGRSSAFGFALQILYRVLAALVSSTLSIRGLGFFLLSGIVRNNRNESFWNFVLIRIELDKGPFWRSSVRSEDETKRALTVD